MTAAQENEMRSNIAEILELLKGPAHDPRQGLVWQTAQHHDDLNGTSKDAPGLKVTVRELDGKASRTEWWIRGLLAAVSAVAVLVGLLGWIISNWEHIKAIKP